MIIFQNREEMIDSLPKDLIIAELGVFKGDFSKILFNVMKPKMLYLVDTFQGYIGSGDKDGTNMVYAHLEEEYIKIKTFFENDKNVIIKKSTTFNFLNNLEEEYLDLVYIDAGHDYQDVYNDLNTSYSKVKRGGFICGHDYVAPRFEGVIRAVNQFCSEKNLSINLLTRDGCPSYCIIKK